MPTLLLDPHGDDCVLFASYLCLREKPHVVVCIPTVPEDEIGAAMEVLGCTWEIGGSVREARRVIAPAFHPEGHKEHNYVSLMASASLGEVVDFYLTYAPRGQRSHGTEVSPEPWMIARKLRALSCFESQIEQASTRPWFYDLLDMREWTT